jgi:hypothetical protein
MLFYVRLLELALYFVEKWSKDEKLKEKMRADVEEARKTYATKGQAEPSRIKKDYDELQDDLRNGKWKV